MKIQMVDVIQNGLEISGHWYISLRTNKTSTVDRTGKINSRRPPGSDLRSTLQMLQRAADRESAENSQKRRALPHDNHPSTKREALYQDNGPRGTKSSIPRGNGRPDSPGDAGSVANVRSGSQGNRRPNRRR